MSWYLAAFAKYAVFNGRACRAEDWWYMLIHIMVLVVLMWLMLSTFFAGMTFLKLL